MILLDTNILSELMRARVSQPVIAWLDQQTASILFICAITRAEIELGLCLLPNGKRKKQLQQAAGKMFDDFAGRCLPFEESAALRYAKIVAHCQQSGRPISVEDAQISAIALTHNMKLATRNTKDFVSIKELKLIDPWNLSNPLPAD